MLGVESTFDESGAALVSVAAPHAVAAHRLASPYGGKYARTLGGVVPPLAAAEHELWLNRVIGGTLDLLSLCVICFICFELRFF